MTTSTLVAPPQPRMALSSNSDTFSRYAVPIIHVILGRSGGSLCSSPDGYALVASELQYEPMTPEKFLERSVEAGLLKRRNRWYSAGSKLPRESPRELRRRCRRVVIDLEPLPPQYDHGYVERRGGNHRPRRRSRS